MPSVNAVPHRGSDGLHGPRENQFRCQTPQSVPVRATGTNRRRKAFNLLMFVSRRRLRKEGNGWVDGRTTCYTDPLMT